MIFYFPDGDDRRYYKACRTYTSVSRQSFCIATFPLSLIFAGIVGYAFAYFFSLGPTKSLYVLVFILRHYLNVGDVFLDRLLVSAWDINHLVQRNTKDIFPCSPLYGA
jgi:multisubunit Na+/H+ antiporter MnhE subunit